MLNKKWEPYVKVDEEEVEKLAEELDRSSLFAKVCLQRGLRSVEEVEKFLAVDANWFHDPFLMNDMEKGVERIVKAIEENKKITIYGDYDADGMTSTALLYESLEAVGANLDYYLPNRFVEGYGPNIDAFDQIIQSGTELIITVDNGVTGHDAINFAQEKGVDVIVTDHHAIPEVLPDAYAIIHPAHPDGEYPFTDLAGVGVALKLASALLGELPVEFLDLAAIGTVADLVTLQGENRAIVYYGLEMMKTTQRIGLQELFKIIEVEPGVIDEDTIGFQIAPRLNAIGRLGDAEPGVDLLISHDIAQARELAMFAEQKNIERKEIVEEMTQQVYEKINKENNNYEAIVLAEEGWHQGVLGIVASRIVERTGKVTLLFSVDPETKIAKGSARSIEGINLYEAFTEIDELFVAYGGHEMAAGMSAETKQLNAIEKALSTYITQHGYKDQVQMIDAFVDLEDLSVETVKELEELKPFGTGNTKPLIATEEVSIVQNRTVGVEGDHLKLEVKQDDQFLDIISFHNGDLDSFLFEEQTVSVLGYVELNEWNGQTKVQMQMIDINLPGAKLIDQRVSKLSPQLFKEENSEYLFYDQNSYEMMKEHIATSSQAILIRDLEEATNFRGENQLIIVDCPRSINQFKATIKNNDHLPTHCYFYKENHLYLTGLPTRKDFAIVYNFLKKQKEVDLKKNGHHMVNYLKINSHQIFLIVRVFLEAKFVIIDNGLLKIKDNPEKMKLQQTKSYKDALEQFQAEELFLYSSFKEIIDALNQ